MHHSMCSALFILFVTQALGIFEKSLKMGKFDESRK
jgi:hypothetical protein